MFFSSERIFPVDLLEGCSQRRCPRVYRLHLCKPRDYEKAPVPLTQILMVGNCGTQWKSGWKPGSLRGNTLLISQRIRLSKSGFPARTVFQYSKSPPYLLLSFADVSPPTALLTMKRHQQSPWVLKSPPSVHEISIPKVQQEVEIPQQTGITLISTKKMTSPIKKGRRWAMNSAS